MRMINKDAAVAIAEVGDGQAIRVPSMADKSGKGGVGDGQRRGDRMRERVKTARGRKLSSTRWLERQLNDLVVAATGRLSFACRL